jgi:transposase
MLPSRLARSGKQRDIGAYLGLVPRRYQSGEVDYVGGLCHGNGSASRFAE